MRIGRTILAASSAALVLGAGAASASAAPAEISFESSGTPVPAGTTFEATAANVKIVERTLNTTFATCATATVAGQVVRSAGVELEVASLTFTGCGSPLFGPYSIVAGGLPWRFGATSPAGSSGFPAHLANWSTAGVTVSSPLGCTAGYSVPALPGGLFVKNVSGGSQVKAVLAGPFNKSAGGCMVPAVVSLTADAQITKVGGVAVTSATNFWAS